MKLQTYLSTPPACILISAFVAACGGGGGSGQQTQEVLPPLDVTFNYGQPDTSFPLWNELTFAPALLDLDGGVPTCTLVAGRLPEGVSLDERTCNLHGTPLELGDFSFRVQLTASGFAGAAFADGSMSVFSPSFDYWGQPLIQGFGWGAPTSSAPQWRNYTPVEGDSYGGFHLTEGTLPLGLSLDPDTGIISGLSKGLGSAPFRVAGTLTHLGKSIDVHTVFEVQPSMDPPQIVNGEWTTAHVGVPFTSAAPRFSTGDAIEGIYEGEFTVEMSANSECSTPSPLPAGVTMDPSTGIISGTAKAPFDGCVAIRYLVTVQGNGGVSGLLPAAFTIEP
jgi:large repetitive protein